MQQLCYTSPTDFASFFQQYELKGELRAFQRVLAWFQNMEEDLQQQLNDLTNS